MGLGTNHQTITTTANFIPEIWSDETIAVYKQQLVLGNLVKKIPFKGKKGDTLHIPNPARGSASVKAASTQVTLIADTAGVIDIAIDKHYEYSYLFEDIADIQALNSMRGFYIDSAGYGLAKRVDQELHKLGAGLQGGATPAAATLYEKGFIGGDGITTFSGAANTNTGNGTALTDTGLRRMIQTLEDSDVNSGECAIILPPVEMNVLRGISRFTEQAFVGDGSVLKTGVFGALYGLDVYATSLCPYIHVNSVTGTQSVTFTSTAPTGASFADDYALVVDWNTSSPNDTKYRAGMILHKEGICLAEQLGVRVQQQYKQEYLGTLVTADTIFGVKELRDYGGVAFVVPA